VIKINNARAKKHHRDDVDDINGMKSFLLGKIMDFHFSSPCDV
jgi:hypothetical protein